jgi:hypothetical protein
MNSDPAIARLVAANPVPALAPSPVPAGPRVRRRRRVQLAGTIVAAAIAIPAVAFADAIGDLLGISNEGTTVVASDTPFSHDPKLAAALQQLGLTTMQLLGQRGDIDFYAARNPAGHFCFALSSPLARGVGCRLDNDFPSAQDPLIDIFTTPEQIAGFASDDVASVALLDESGATIATIPVTDNIYALPDPPAGGTEVEALDGNGDIITSHMIPEKP